MKWFFRWLNSKIQSSYNGMLVASEPSGINRNSPAFEKDPTLNFLIHHVNGGKIVDFRKYDRNKHEWDSTTYVITDKEDIGELISKMVTMELLKV